MSDRVASRLRRRLDERKKEQEQIAIQMEAQKIRLEKEKQEEEKKEALSYETTITCDSNNSLVYIEKYLESSNISKDCRGIISEYMLVRLPIPIVKKCIKECNCGIYGAFRKMIIAMPRILILSQDGIYYFDFWTGVLKWHKKIECISAMAVSPSGKFLAFNDCRHLEVHLYQWNSRFETHSFLKKKFIKYVEKLVVDNDGNVYMEHSQTSVRYNFVDFYGRESDVIHRGVNDMQLQYKNQGRGGEEKQLYVGYASSVEIYSLEINDKNLLEIQVLQKFTMPEFFIHGIYLFGQDIVVYDKSKAIGRFYKISTGEFLYSFKYKSEDGYQTSNCIFKKLLHPLYPWIQLERELRSL